MRIMDKMKASILAFEFCLSQKINYLITRFNRLDEILTHGREIGTPYENSIMRDAFVGLRNYLLKELLSLQHYLSKVLTWEFYQSLDFRNSFMCN